jgi:hypothetical protein
MRLLNILERKQPERKEFHIAGLNGSLGLTSDHVSTEPCEGTVNAHNIWLRRGYHGGRWETARIVKYSVRLWEDALALARKNSESTLPILEYAGASENREHPFEYWGNEMAGPPMRSLYQVLETPKGWRPQFKE